MVVQCIKCMCTLSTSLTTYQIVGKQHPIYKLAFWLGELIINNIYTPIYQYNCKNWHHCGKIKCVPTVRSKTLLAVGSLYGAIMAKKKF